jgi:GT2 family glycosyltransferase
LDDPSLVDGFRQQAIRLQRLYKLPFVWLWGGVNRGFSGANNLGAQQARGKKLVFLNSDAFPQRPGWLETLTRVLDERTDIGAVAPRLLFADGSIQHASMEFRRAPDLGIWTNHHPSMGLDPALDPHTSLAIVPAVTGACMAIRQKDFERVGGWDTGYLIGDFEDSDLCFKLRQIGLSIGYLPTVQLTHLERQSFKMLGQDEFRTRVMIYNAVRHQMRWKDRLETAEVGPS